MTTDEVRKALRAEPFVPFRLHMGGGRSLAVLHPEFCMLSPNGRTAAIYPHDRQSEPGLEVVDILMVQSLEFLPGARSTSRRRKAG